MMQNFWAIKIYSRNYTAGIRGKKKNPCLKLWSYPKKYLPKFSDPKNPENENFKLQNSFNHPCHLKSRVPPLGFQPSAPVQGFLWRTLQAVADPDLQIRRWGGGGHPDPEISGGPSLKKKFQAFGPQSGLKIRGRSLTSRYSVMVANP